MFDSKSQNSKKGNNPEKIFDLLRWNKELWSIFTRNEEYNANLLDRFERFPYYASRNKNIFDPEVSKFLIENGLNIEYPEGKEFAICLTHDIDTIRFSTAETVLDVGKFIYRNQLKNAVRRPFCAIKKWNPIWNFEKIMDLEDKYSAKSTFFLMGLKRGDLSFNYKPEDLSDEMGRILDRGWEIGLHGGHEAYKNLEVLRKEKDVLERALGKRVIGYRNHALRFKVPNTWNLLQEAGFKYDTTLGYADCVGFRNGMCHPFWPFDLNSCHKVDIMEIPLIIMEVTMEEYMRLDMEAAWMLTKRLIDTVRKYHGVLTILWHNDYMNDEGLKFYTKILNYGKEKGAWMTSCENVYRFWITQSIAES